MSTPKQKLARETNWRTAQIRGCVAVLAKIADELAYPGTGEMVRSCGKRLEQRNKELFTIKRALL